MQLKKFLKFRYKDLPEEFLCFVCHSLCYNPQPQIPNDGEPDYCDQINPSFSITLYSQILYSTEIQCDFCGKYEKYYHYKIHKNMCQLIFQKSQFLSNFTQISINYQNIKCFICNQLPYRPQVNEENQLICLSCLQQRNILNTKELSNEQQKNIDEILLQCNSAKCQKIITINNALNHYCKCQLKYTDIIKSEDYLTLVCLDQKYQLFKQECKKHSISLKYQKQLLFNIKKIIYDCQKTKLIKKQLRLKMKNRKNYIKEIEDMKNKINEKKTIEEY